MDLSEQRFLQVCILAMIGLGFLVLAITPS